KTRFTHASVPYVLVNGTVIANDWADLTDGTLAAPINVTEGGSTLAPGEEAWTGTSDPDGGNTVALDCHSWTTTSGSVQGIAGDANLTNAGWTASTTRTCNLGKHLYCFQQ